MLNAGTCPVCKERPADSGITVTVTARGIETGNEVASEELAICEACAERLTREMYGTPGSSMTIEFGDAIEED